MLRKLSGQVNFRKITAQWPRARGLPAQLSPQAKNITTSRASFIAGLYPESQLGLMPVKAFGKEYRNAVGFRRLKRIVLNSKFFNQLRPPLPCCQALCGWYQSKFNSYIGFKIEDVVPKTLHEVVGRSGAATSCSPGGMPNMARPSPRVILALSLLSSLRVP